jgi:hypothetical protein
MNDSGLNSHLGITIDNLNFSNDVLLLIVFVLLTVFAVIFRLNILFFRQMVSNMNADEHRVSIFGKTDKDSFFFYIFLSFQTILLTGIFCYFVSIEYGVIQVNDGYMLFLYLAAIFIILLIYFYLKKFIYNVFGSVFTNNDDKALLLMNYRSIFSVWGIILYIPVLWILLVREYIFFASIMFILSYIAFRLMMAYRFIHIFLNKNTGILFLSLYLCSQEIVPLVLLYKVLINLDSIIEINNIWH